MISSVSLMDMMKEHLSFNELQLPVLSPAALELQRILSNEDGNIDEIAQKIQLDQALASEVLRVANSAFYGGLKQVGTIRESIMRLGTKEVMNLVLLTTQRQQYSSSGKFLAPYVGTLWKHASCCAKGSKWLAERLGHPGLAQEAFLAGLLHDIGRLFLLRVLENIHSTGKHYFTLSEAALVEILESMHAAQGALLLERWNLPQVYCDTARLHHAEDYDFSNTVVTVVRLVDLACHKIGIGQNHDPALVLATSREAKELQVSEMVLAELEIMLEDAVESIA